MELLKVLGAVFVVVVIVVGTVYTAIAHYDALQRQRNIDMAVSLSEVCSAKLDCQEMRVNFVAFTKKR